MSKTKNNGFQIIRWLIFSILALAYFLVYFHRLSLSVVADDLIRELHTTASTMGLLGSVYFYCYALMQIPVGVLSDSLGPRKTVTWSLILAAAGSIIFALVPNIKLAFLGRILVGIGVSAVFIPTMKILSQWFRAYEFAFMAGLLNAMGGAGVLTATWVLALVTGHFGWRQSFIAIGLSTIILSVLVWIIVRDRPSDQGYSDIIHKNSAPDKLTHTNLLPVLKKILYNKYFWAVAIWFFFDAGIFFGFGALWAGPYLMHVYGLTRSETGSILSMLACGMIIGSPLLGLISDRLMKSRKKVIILSSSILVLLFIFLSISPAGQSKLTLYCWFFVFSLSASSIVSIGFTTTKELFPVEIAGTSVGLVNFFPFLGGAIFMSFLGQILDSYPQSAQGNYTLEGYTTILLILLGSALATLICSFFMKETYPAT